MKKYNWFMIFILTIIPIIGVIGTSYYTYFYGIVWQEPILLILGWLSAGMGITFGYHRLFAHRSFKAHPIIQFLAMIFGSSALQNNILKWCSDHRLHHKKLDTSEDPYSITKGFFHAHIGWILENKKSKILAVNDLKKNPIVMFQFKYYWIIAILFAFIIPMLIGYAYGRPLGGLLWGGFLRVTLVHHFTFCINSLCHFSGKQTFDYNSSAKDSWWVALLTFGEGFHSFHHRFQWDYRNGIRWYDFDPVKWSIKLLSYLKLTTDIRKVEEYKIFEAKFNTLTSAIEHHISNAPYNLKKNYKSKLETIQTKSTNLYNQWKIFESDLHQSRANNTLTRKEKNRNRKRFQLEYQSILNTLSLLLVLIKNN